MITKLYHKAFKNERFLPEEVAYATNCLESGYDFNTRIKASLVLLILEINRGIAVKTVKQLVKECVETRGEPDFNLSHCLQLLQKEEIASDPAVLRYIELSMIGQDVENKVNVIPVIGHLVEMGEWSLVRWLHKARADEDHWIKQASEYWIKRLMI